MGVVSRPGCSTDFWRTGDLYGGHQKACLKAADLVPGRESEVRVVTRSQVVDIFAHRVHEAEQRESLTRSDSSLDSGTPPVKGDPNRAWRPCVQLKSPPSDRWA